jgi:hypothetical protein
MNRRSPGALVISPIIRGGAGTRKPTGLAERGDAASTTRFTLGEHARGRSHADGLMGRLAQANDGGVHMRWGVEMVGFAAGR